MGARLPRSTDRNTAAITILDLPRKPERHFPAAPRLTWSSPHPRKTSRCTLPSILRHFPTSQCTSHRNLQFQIGTCALREQPHQHEDNFIIERLRTNASSRGTALETKPASAFFVRPPRPRKPSELRQHHRLRHAWLASHHRAPSSQQSKFFHHFRGRRPHIPGRHPFPVAIAVRWQCCKNRERPSRARFATGLAAGTSTGDWSLRWIFRRRLLSIAAPSRRDTD